MGYSTIFTCQNYHLSAILNMSAAFRQEGGETIMEIIITLLTAVAAHVIAHYICRWLDGLLADK